MMLLAGRSEISREFQIWYVARKSKLQRRNVCESRLRQTRYATSVTSAVTADYVAPSPSLLQVGADYQGHLTDSLRPTWQAKNWQLEHTDICFIAGSFPQCYNTKLLTSCQVKMAPIVQLIVWVAHVQNRLANSHFSSPTLEVPPPYDKYLSWELERVEMYGN